MEQNHNKTSEATNAEFGEAISWSGSFAQNYDQYLGPFIFGRYAEDLVQRVNPDTLGAVLEIACGTGQLTQSLLERLNAEARLTSTDISLEMMAVAQRKIQASNVTWRIADMCAPPFGDGQFDLVICQFGLMFAADKLLALKEMARLLRVGGKLLINTWAEIKDNAVFYIFNRVIKQLTRTDPMLSEQGPFSLSDSNAVIQLLKESGFKEVTVEAVLQTGEIETAGQAVKGFFDGSLMSVSLKEKNPALAVEVSRQVEDAFIVQLGNNPVRSPLKAWVFQAQKL